MAGTGKIPPIQSLFLAQVINNRHNVMVEP
jgi:hypothetical protein